MGPSAAGLTSTRGAARPTFAPAPPRASTGGAHGTSLTPTMVKVEKRGGVEARQPDEDEEAYSDQEDGVEIIDIQRVREMDWSAPEPLRKEKKREKKKDKDKKVKAEEDARVKMEKGKDAEKMEVYDEGTPVGDEADVDAANALNLSESEEEEEMEDLIEDFRARTDQDVSASFHLLFRISNALLPDLRRKRRAQTTPLPISRTIPNIHRSTTNSATRSRCRSCRRSQRKGKGARKEGRVIRAGHKTWSSGEDSSRRSSAGRTRVLRRCDRAAGGPP